MTDPNPDPATSEADPARGSSREWSFKPASDHGLPPYQRWKSERREPGLLSTLAHATTLAGLRTYLKLYNRVNIEGIEHVPSTTPFVICANHASHIDALVIAASLPCAVRGRVFPIAAGDVFFEVPARAAATAMLMNALPLWRKKAGRHALDDLKQRLHAGDCGYILFPEGARTRDGKPLPFKPGIGMLLAGSRVPVVPCRLTGCFEALRPETVWPRPAQITVSFRRPRAFEEFPNSREGWESIVTSIREAILGPDAG